jgi:hypothetical protein
MVLVGFAEALSAPETVWSLVDDGFQVVAFARRGRKSALRHSRHIVCHEITAPEVDLQASLAELRALMALLARDAHTSQRILFPLDDKGVWLGSKLKLEEGWLQAGPQGSCAELALNKCQQAQIARDAGFKVPKTALARTAAEVFAFSTAESFPIILKPAECVPVRQGRLHECRKFVCANAGELERAVAEWGETIPLLVQSFVTGTGEGVFGLATSGGVKAWSAHRRLRMMNPHGSGSSACISQSVPQDLRVKVEAFVARAGWRGMFMIELLRDHDGNLWFVELNGRPWGSMALSRAQGLEYPAWHVQLAIDQPAPPGMELSSDAGVVCRHAGREFMHLLFVLKGPKSKALSSWPPFWRTLAEVARVRQGDVFYNWRRDDPKVFVADFCYTIKDNIFKSKS